MNNASNFIEVISHEMLNADGSSSPPSTVEIKLYDAKNMRELKELLEVDLKKEGVSTVQDIDINSTGRRYTIPEGFGIASVGGHRAEVNKVGGFQEFDLEITGAYRIMQ